MNKIKLPGSPSIAPAFSRISTVILNFFRSIFKKRIPIPEPEPLAEIEPDEKEKKLRRKWAAKKTREAEKEFRLKAWRTPAETRSLIKQLRPGDQFFDKAGNTLAVYKILTRRKLGVLLEAEDGQRWNLHFMGLQSKVIGPDFQ